MFATGLFRAACLPLCLGVALTPSPAGEIASASAAECVPGSCDPLCVDIGRYTVTPEIVDDAQTGHMLWQRLVAMRLAQPDAARYCTELTLEGLGGWRLPAPTELSGIRYKPGGLFGGGSSRHYCIPCLDQAAFPETPAAPFWTSRSGADDTAWYVGFDDGRMHRDARSELLWVRCAHDPLAAAAPPADGGR